MSDGSLNKPSWFDRLAHALLREPQDREQLIELLRDAKDRDLFDADALKMIEGVLRVSEMQVRDIMIPRTQMVVVDHDAKLKDFLPIIVNSGHSRFPVMGENHDEVIGILLAKDILKYSFNNEEKNPFSMQDLLRPMVIVPESKRLDALLQEFRIKHNHMAIIIDEYGSVAGLVTIEDVLEQIVGEIEDEYDVEDVANIKKQSETQSIVKALTPIEEFNDYFQTDFSDEEFDTIGGYVTHHFGHLPKRGESATIKPLRFKVLNADERRVHLLRVTLQKK